MKRLALALSIVTLTIGFSTHVAEAESDFSVTLLGTGTPPPLMNRLINLPVNLRLRLQPLRLRSSLKLPMPR